MKKLYDPAFFNRRHAEAYRSAERMLRYMFDIYKPDSIVDFGCGTGAWLRAAGDLGVSDLTGIDGNWIDSRYFSGTAIRFVPMSLEEPISLEQKYDLAISVEVIEHLRPERGDSFVYDLCQAADVIIFSGAIPDQGGIHHVNERWQSHWVEIFARLDFRCIDIFRAKFWQDTDIAPWYRQNAFLFVRDSCQDLLKWKYVHTDLIVNIVHPEIYQSAPRIDYISGWDILRALPHVLTRRWRKCVGS